MTKAIYKIYFCRTCLFRIHAKIGEEWAYFENHCPRCGSSNVGQADCEAEPRTYLRESANKVSPERERDIVRMYSANPKTTLNGLARRFHRSIRTVRKIIREAKVRIRRGGRREKSKDL